jgi:hypothetical protein
LRYGFVTTRRAQTDADDVFQFFYVISDIPDSLIRCQNSFMDKPLRIIYFYFGRPSEVKDMLNVL